MIFGIGLFLFGYALIYWGIGHFPNQQRYNLWQLLGIRGIPAGTPIKLGG